MSQSLSAPLGPFAMPVRIALRWMAGAVCLLPFTAVLYLWLWQDPALRFESHGFHGLAIVLATLEGAALTVVCWRCYLRTGEWLLRRLTQAFLAFTVVYSLHGAFTPLAEHHLALFLIYGPASRLSMAGLLLLAVLGRGKAADPPERRGQPRPWWTFLAGLVALVVVLGLVATSPAGQWAGVRLGMEVLAGGLSLVSLGLLGRAGGNAPVLRRFSQALLWLSAASLGFVLSQPWNHLWWLAHGLAAVGFSILGYGVLQAYLSTQSLDRVVGVEELFEDLAKVNARLVETLHRQERTNAELQQQVRAKEMVEASFGHLFASVSEAALIVQTNGVIRLANAAAGDLLRCAPSHLQGRVVEDLVPAGLRAAHAGRRQLQEYTPQQRRMGVSGGPLPCQRLDGTAFPARIHIGGLSYEGERHFLVRISEMPVPDRAAASTPGPDAAADLPWLQSLLELHPAPLLVMRRTADGRYAADYRHRACSELFGIDDSLGGEAWTQAWLKRIYPADLPTLLSALESSALKGEPLQVRCRHHLPGQGLQRWTLRSQAPVCDAQGQAHWVCQLEEQA